MSEDDRAAKAARAKALLKKRQQKKATDSLAASTTSAAASPGSPSRTSTPAPPEPVVEPHDGRDIGDVFAQSDAADTSWLSSLPRVGTPPPPPPPAQTSPPTTGRRVSLTSPPAANAAALQQKLDELATENESLKAAAGRFEAAAGQAEASLAGERARVEELQQSYQKLRDDTEVALQNEQRTVSLLVTEKAHLASELQKLGGFEARVQEVEDLLEAERSKSEGLDSQVLRLQAQVNSVVGRAERAEAKEKDLSERYKEKASCLIFVKERELQLASASVAELRKEVDESRRKLRELEEQIQSDDRVERLENSLKHTQDRADELEFQLTKLKQTHSTLKGEKDALEAKVAALSTSEIDHQSQIATLDASLAGAREQLAAAEKERTAAAQEAARLEAQSQSLEASVAEHQERLNQAAAALAAGARQLQSTQGELRGAVRRADEAERTQQSLQAEGTALMRALDEMRPKIVELTGAKLDLAERVAGLGHTVRARDAAIAQLENEVGEAREQAERAEASGREKLAEQERRHRDAQNGTADLQTANAELQEELDTALASLRNLEAQRTTQHQEAARRLEEIERLTNASHEQSEELSALRKELEARTQARDEEQDFLERAQNEVETLRTELSAREAEIAELREAVNTPASDAPRSLDDELLSSLRQQHAIEISAATSQVRALEHTVFDKESALHRLQKHVAGLEEQLAQLRTAAARVRSSPAPSRPASRGDLRRSSLGVARPPPAAAAARAIFGHNMSAETLHKRQVSLSMLKARIESEAALPGRALSPVASDGPSRPASRAQGVAQHRSPFLDESHVFWCHGCQGDLVIL